MEERALFRALVGLENVMQNRDFSIRPYDADRDLKALSQIWFDASIKAHEFLGEERIAEQRELIETLYLPSAETFVAYDETETLGFISLLGDFIGGLFVKPEAQGQGVGQGLIAHARALRDGLSVSVYLDNQKAYHFYHSIGFTDGETKERDDQRLPFSVMTMHLNEK
jgi:putative acetyltransferase